MKGWKMALLAAVLMVVLCGCPGQTTAVSRAPAFEMSQQEPVLEPYTEEEILALFERARGRQKWAVTVIDCVPIDDFAYGRVGAVLFSEENNAKTVYVAFLNGEGIFQRCGVEHRVEDGTSLTYLGDGEVSFPFRDINGTTYRCSIRFSREGSDFYFVHGDAPAEE